LSIIPLNLTVCSQAYDTLHNFAPTYHDYILYSDGTAAAPRRFRTRTFVPTGHEMSDLRKGGKDSGWSSGLERADRGSESGEVFHLSCEFATVHNSFHAISWVVIPLLIILVIETAGHSRRLPTGRSEVEDLDSVGARIPRVVRVA
jgi:hypothetical protein